MGLVKWRIAGSTRENGLETHLPRYHADLGGTRHVFDDLRALLAAASPARSGDMLAGVGAQSAEERVAARFALADLPLAAFLNEVVIPYEKDEVTSSCTTAKGVVNKGPCAWDDSSVDAAPKIDLSNDANRFPRSVLSIIHE